MFWKKSCRWALTMLTAKTAAANQKHTFRYRCSTYFKLFASRCWANNMQISASPVSISAVFELLHVQVGTFWYAVLFCGSYWKRLFWIECCISSHGIGYANFVHTSCHNWANSYTREIIIISASRMSPNLTLYFWLRFEAVTWSIGHPGHRIWCCCCCCHRQAVT